MHRVMLVGCQVVLSRFVGPELLREKCSNMRSPSDCQIKQINGPRYLAMESYKMFSVRDIVSMGPTILQGTLCDFSTLDLILDRWLSLSHYGELHEGYE